MEFLNPRFFIEDDEGNRYPVMAGGDGEGEGDGKAAADEGSEGLDGGKGGGGEDGKGPIPYERFSEVNTERQTLARTLEGYKKLGSPEEIAAKIARGEELGQGTPYTQKELKEIEGRLLAIPAFKRVVDFMEGQSKTSEAASKTFVDSMRSRTSDYMKDMGLEFKDDKDKQRTQYMIEAVLAEAVRSDPVLLQRWQLNDKTVMEDAIKAAQSVLGPLRRSINAKIQGNKSPVKPVLKAVGDKKPEAPATPEDPRDVERRILSEAADRGYKILEERGAN